MRELHIKKSKSCVGVPWRGNRLCDLTVLRPISGVRGRPGWLFRTPSPGCIDMLLACGPDSSGVLQDLTSCLQPRRTDDREREMLK